MSQIEELQSRISAAMERISAGVEALAVPQAAEPGEDVGTPDADLVAALEDERMANAQLEERLRAIKVKHAAEIEALRSAASGDQDDELERLRDELAEARASLARVEAEAATSDMSEETEALRTEVALLRAQLDAVEDAEPLKEEIETLKAQADSSELVDGLRAEIAALKAELGTSERLSELQAELEMLRAERKSHGETMSQLDGDLQRLRKANDQLRSVVSDLRAANEAGVGEPHLINSAMLAELEALRAQRATDAAEVHAVLSKLGPLLSAANLAEGEDE